MNSPETPSKTGPVTAAYLRYPDLTGGRRAEGGLRLQGAQKQSQPDAPLVTLLTVCWNAAETLEQMLASVAAQTYENFEHVVVDGASTDGTLKILQTHEEQLAYFISEPDQGLYYAMNKALELAQGDLILFLNADDWYEPKAIETLVRAHQESGCDFVSSLANYVDQDGVFERVQPISPFDAGAEFRMPLRHETMLIPREIYNAAGGYNTDYRIIADRVFTAGLFWRGYTHHCVQEPLLNFRTTGTSSVDLDKLYAERTRALKTRFPGLSPQALRDLAHLEQITPQRLLEISRVTRSAPFRAAAMAYALDREAQGHKPWQDIDLEAFSPVLGSKSVIKAGARAKRATLAEKHAPMVSVILPVYNAEDMLAECLDSVLAQTMHDLEILCINDQTPDGSQKIIEDYAARDPRVKPRLNERNCGLGTSRNRGIALAQGRFIFHIDPDDVIPPDALEKLVEMALDTGSDMTRGAFLHEQMFQGQEAQSTRKGLDEGTEPITNATLCSHPDFLRSTEGHWSYLYRAEFAKRVFYPEDLKMGQDSIFLTQALIAARSISVIPDVIYHYRANAQSAMNVYNFRKYIDEIEWRVRAWEALDQAGLSDLGDHLLCNYWNLPFFEALNGRFDAAQKTRFWRKLSQAFVRASNQDLSKTNNPALKQAMQGKLAHFAALPGPAVQPKSGRPLKIEVLSTSDHGGAGLAARRSVEGLRERGHHARLHCLFAKGSGPHIWPLPIAPAHHDAGQDPKTLHEAWRRMAVLTHQEMPGLSARELYSKTGHVTDLATLRATLQQADVVHLHWISGVLEPEMLSWLVGDTPVVWTLHDMNPFTGGCHYSEGCTGYQTGCRACPLLPQGADLAAQAVGHKQMGLKGIRDLRVIAPSEWLADCARASALFAGRPVAMIPNIFPAHAFVLTNKILARQKLGLPLDRKLVLFGADNLNNRRKGGDLLQSAMQQLIKTGQCDGVEAVVFGASGLDLSIPCHAMGYVEDPSRLALIYAAADVFAFPSREDNAPQTVIESMLSGTPVVGFDSVGNVPELIEHEKTGYLARYEDPEDFAKGLAWALQDAGSGQAITRGLTCHIQAQRHNDPDQATACHIALYRDMLDNPPSKTRAPLAYGVLGASTSQQSRHHESGEITGYSEALRLNHAARLHSKPDWIARYCYPGNRLSDGGLIQLEALCAAKPDICLFEPLIEDGSRGRNATEAELRHVYARLIDRGIVPVTCLIPLPAGRPLAAFPQAQLIQEICKEYDLPIFRADIAAILAQGGNFNGVHTTAKSAPLLATQLARFLGNLPLHALKERISTRTAPKALVHVAQQEMGQQPCQALRLELTPKDDLPYRFRVVQNQSVGPHSGILATRILQNGHTIAEQHVPVWDRYCHYARDSYVVMCRDDMPCRGPVTIEITLSPDLPDYARAARADITWPHPSLLTLHPRGAVHVLSDAALELKVLETRADPVVGPDIDTNTGQNAGSDVGSARVA